MKFAEIKKINPSTLKKSRDFLSEGKLKDYLRTWYTRFLSFRFGILEVGEGFRWGRDWDIKRSVLRIGHFAYIGPRVQIIYPTNVGDLVLIAADVHFVGKDHAVDQCGVPMRIAVPNISPYECTTVVESEVWVGQRSVIFHGVTIGRGAVIASGSVVTKDVPAYSIVAGVPAKILRTRFENKKEENAHDDTLYSSVIKSDGNE